jgi:16S rRNA (uracil1498-N3)-methyltransferase
VRIPELAPLSKPEAAFSSHSDRLKILLSERPESRPLRGILEGQSVRAAVVLAIGPEGGWTEAEVQRAQTHGFREASLGRLILRTETAVIAALASVNYGLSGQES